MTGPVAPPRPDIPKRLCGAGITPCGQPARLYTCGWRCRDHTPDTQRKDSR